MKYSNDKKKQLYSCCKLHNVPSEETLEYFNVKYAWSTPSV